MEKIIEQVANWSFFEQLPAEYAGLKLRIEKVQQGTQYHIFTYENSEQYKSFSVLYDQATKDYFARVVVGLTEYYDVSFIVTSLEELEKALAERMRRTLDCLANPVAQGYESIVVDKKILEWPFVAELPKSEAGFELFINPHSPLKTINGSYIIIDYSDFANESNLIIYFNVYRDEFFGEIRVRRTPRMTTFFDAKELDDLAEKLKDNLKTVLTSMREEIG